MDGMVSFCQDKEQLYCSNVLPSPGFLRSNPGRDLGTCISTSTSFPSTANSFTNTPLPYKESEKWSRATLARKGNQTQSVGRGKLWPSCVSFSGVWAMTVWGYRAPGQNRGSGWRKLSKIKQERGNYLRRVINLFCLDGINRKTGSEGDILCKIVGLILFKSAHLILAKRLRKWEEAELSYEVWCWPALDFGRWLASDNPKLWAASRAKDINHPLMATGAQGPGFSSHPQMLPPEAQKGHTYLWNTRFYPLFFNFSISSASLLSLRTDCFKPVCLQR